MISSMTAFARGQAEGDWGMLVWELRSVNHRYMDISFRIPEAFRELEQSFRELLQQQLSRGKLEVNLKFQPGPALTPNISVNQPLLDQLAATHQSMKQHFNDSVSVSLNSLLQWPGMLQEERPDMAPVRKIATDCLQDTVNKLKEVRQREGGAIVKMLDERLQSMQQQVEMVQQHLPDILATQREKLNERLTEVLERIDSERVEQEIVHFAQRIDVSEETDRLQTHIEEVSRVLKKGGTVGRRLDFLMQELNREANTLASKSVSTNQSHVAVELKVLIEQMREQVQNVE